MISHEENKYAEYLQIGDIRSEEEISIDKADGKIRKGRIIDATKTARKGYFLEVPKFICRNVE